MYAILQMGLMSSERYTTREDAERAANRLNAEADEECGEEVWGDGAATVVEVEE